MGLEPRFYVGKSFRTIYVRLSGSKEVEVRTIYKEDGLGHCERGEEKSSLGG
jgi:hypothetical protein